MAGNQRSYTEATRSALFALSAKCYFPNCGQPSVTIFGDQPRKEVEIAHIRAISPNGPRYNPPGHPPMTVQERNSFSNLILLCRGIHHPEVDSKANEHIYTVAKLRQWKTVAEKDMRAKVDGLDRLTEDRLNDMLIDATQNAKHELVSAIDELADVSQGAGDLLRALFEKIENHYLDAESIALLHAASNRLGFLEEGSNLLYSASERLGDFEANAATMSMATERLQEFDINRFVLATLRLEQFASEYPGMMHDQPSVPDIAGSIEHAGRQVVSMIDRELRSIDLNDVGRPVSAERVVVRVEDRGKYFAWGVAIGVLAVLAIVIILASTGAI
jgi:hypothetical protein